MTRWLSIIGPVWGRSITEAWQSSAQKTRTLKKSPFQIWKRKELHWNCTISIAKPAKSVKQRANCWICLHFQRAQFVFAVLLHDQQSEASFALTRKVKFLDAWNTCNQNHARLSGTMHQSPRRVQQNTYSNKSKYTQLKPIAYTKK